MGTLYIKVPFQSQFRRFLRTLSSSSTIFVSVVLLKPTLSEEPLTKKSKQDHTNFGLILDCAHYLAKVRRLVPEDNKLESDLTLHSKTVET